VSEPTAAILLAHGSPDPRWSASAERVRLALAARRPSLTVALAFLPPSRPDLTTAVGALVRAGHTHVVVLPLFLSSGGKHLRADVPALLTELRAAHPSATLAIASEALGETDEAIEAFAAAADRLLR
jgi:sirohydrochlorin cobaltochelatase